MLKLCVVANISFVRDAKLFCISRNHEIDGVVKIASQTLHKALTSVFSGSHNTGKGILVWGQMEVCDLLLNDLVVFCCRK